MDELLEKIREALDDSRLKATGKLEIIESLIRDPDLNGGRDQPDDWEEEEDDEEDEE